MGQTQTGERIPCPQGVLRLVKRFSEQREAYLGQMYNETQARREFIDPLFKALGWDIDNEQGAAEAYKDVIHEDAIKVGGASKAPDYCFRIGGTRKFFVEAKKPAVGVGDDPGPAYQVRRYAWSNKLPLSIVTDFEEFAVYDCRIPPKAKDKASVARVLYLTFDQYEEKWNEIASVFSKEAILKGSFDKYAESNKRKKGTAEVDEEILKEIESWRESLARNFALRNENLSVRDLNFAVERTIDRVIFLRMCEDRSIEPYGRLQGLLNGSAVYERLGQLFREADDKYNAGLFYFRQEAERGPPDELTLALALDDKVLKEIIVRLYYPESPYEFSVLPPEILGQVYEQFLGKVIRLTAGHRAVVEEKPEVRKAGGVYYTPTYIVEYIVKNTVGKLLEGKTPAEVGPERETKTGKRRKLAKSAKMLRVLDPACGSGSFLLGAYQYLLDWHRDAYVQEGPDKYKERIYQGAGGQWRLSIREKKRILLNNIYGVDIDAQAVEVTKLSLLLKVLEGETAETIGSTLRLFHERALPDLAENIKCGNSLIGPDFYEGRQMSLLDEEARYRINAFDWKAEFPEVFSDPNRDRKRAEAGAASTEEPLSDGRGTDRVATEPLADGRGTDQGAGGFDAVIGNPPYGAAVGEHEIAYLREKYQTPANSLDSFLLFVERSTGLLCAGGSLGLIIPSGWVSAPSSKQLRELFLREYKPDTFVSLPFDVFKNAYIDTVIVTADRNSDARKIGDDVVDLIVFPARFKVGGQDDFEAFRKQAHSSSWSKTRHSVFPITCSTAEASLLDKVESAQHRLGDCVLVKRGVEKYEPRARDGMQNPVRALAGTLQRYLCDLGGRKYEDYTPEVQSQKPFEYFSNKRILIRQVLSRKLRIQATLATETFLTNQSVQSLLLRDDAPFQVSLECLLAIINSRLMSWYFRNSNSVARRDDFPKIIIQQTRDLPLIGPVGAKAHDRLCSLVDQILHMLTTQGKSALENEKTSLQRQIDATDGEIDRLVYELYGLTEEEIRIVEEGTK